MQIGKAIKLYLVENNISQLWLSEETKISPPKLNASLNDKRKLSAEEYGSIIEALGVPATKFM